MCELYHTSKSNVSEHIKHIIEEGELQEGSVVRNFRTTASDGKSYLTTYYNLDMIIALGYRVRSIIATRFRQWATVRLKEYITKGFTLDDDRLKKLGGGGYWKELLERIRDIRSTEKVLYRQMLEIYATSIDYDAKAETTRLFFARVQNQLHWAIHGETAAETIYRRADSSKEHMGLTTWKDAPNGKIQKFDVVIAKNYLTQEELSAMARIVNAYLDLAELRAEEQVPMTMEDWAEQFEGVLRLSRKEILTNAGSISAKIAEQHALSEFEKYRIVQDQLYQSDFDRILLEKDSYTNELPEAKDGGE